MEPRPSDEGLQIGGRFSLVSWACGMGPLLILKIQGNSALEQGIQQLLTGPIVLHLSLYTIDGRIVLRRYLHPIARHRLWSETLH